MAAIGNTEAATANGGTYSGYATASDYGAYYGFGSSIYNWLTGNNTKAEQMAEQYNAEQTNLFNSEQAALDRAWQSEEAQKTRDWEEYMSNSSYQRMMADAEKAGINPLYLVGSGGASSYSGATASGGAAARSGGSPNYDNNSKKKSGGDATKNVMDMAKTALQIAMLFAMVAG